jgi:hypothetical protein
MGSRPRKSVFIPYAIGDWIVPIKRPRGKWPLFKCEGFSGNYVYARPMEFGAEPERLLKRDFRKANEKDVSKSVAWRMTRSN